MKKFFLHVLIITCFISQTVHAEAINQIVFFGDSLSDDGNLHSLLLKIVPKSPPYFRGRFSNGQTWAEKVGKYFYDRHYTGYKIYAFGAATATAHAPTRNIFFYPITLKIEIYNYLLTNLLKNKGSTLYSLWIGGNDYLFYNLKKNPDNVTSEVVRKISWSIHKLIKHGGKNFLIINLPDLSMTPYAQYSKYKEKYHVLTMMHNVKLANLVNQLRIDYPEMKFIFVDANAFFNDIVQNPGKYNRRYHVHIKYTQGACWMGGYLLDAGREKSSLTHSLAYDVPNALTQEISDNPADSKSLKETNVDFLAKYIVDSPEIAFTYDMGKQFERGHRPCPNPNEYVYWDLIHPTEALHNVMAGIIEEFLPKEIMLAKNYS